MSLSNKVLEKSYSEYIPPETPSTLYDYIKQVNKICKRERIVESVILET